MTLHTTTRGPTSSAAVNLVPAKVNLGCGRRFLSTWINIDFVSTDASVMSYDLRRGVPLADNSVDFIYSSHVLEHFCYQNGASFIREQYRVLRPGGIIRVVVPDLEYLARTYLDALGTGRRDTSIDQRAMRTWLRLALFDQACRNSSGGEMSEFLAKSTPQILLPIFRLEGTEIENLFNELTSLKADLPEPRTPSSSLRLFVKSLYLRGLQLCQRARRRHLFLTVRDRMDLEVGRFRRSGEVHYCMYDDLLLSELLLSVGFEKPSRKGPRDSLFEDWISECLDTEPDGSTYKPASLFMEARKPLDESRPL